MLSLENEFGTFEDLWWSSRLAFNRLLAMGESFPHTCKEQVGCQSVVPTIYTVVGIRGAEETAGESSLQLYSPH